MHLVSSDGDAVWQRIFLQSFPNHWEHLISYTLVLGDDGGGGGGGGGGAGCCKRELSSLILIVQHILLHSNAFDLRWLLQVAMMTGLLSFY